MGDRSISAQSEEDESWKNFELIEDQIFNYLFTTARTRWPLLCLLGVQYLQSGLVLQCKHNLKPYRKPYFEVWALTPVTAVITDKTLKLGVPLANRDWRGCLCLLQGWPEPSSAGIKCFCKAEIGASSPRLQKKVIPDIHMFPF